jgi:hypothetical protein
MGKGAKNANLSTNFGNEKFSGENKGGLSGSSIPAGEDGCLP